VDKLKPKKCRVCSTVFTPARPLQRVCSGQCALAHVKAEDKRKAAKVKREGRRALRGRSDWLKLAQAAFNGYIRARDRELPCISCGRATKAKQNAGHYLSVGSHPELRFDEDGCHKQCEHCNSWKSGNAVEYRRRLIERIGLPRVEWLEGPHEPKKYTIEELDSLCKTYRAKTRELQRSLVGITTGRAVPSRQKAGLL